MSKFFLYLGCITLFYFYSSCEYSKLMEPLPPALCDTLNVGYTVQVKGIIDKNCAFSGCHVSNTPAPGDFQTYESMRPYLDDTKFKRYVIDLKDNPDLGMPPNWDNNPGPKDLTQEELEIIECWINSDYAE